MTRRITNQKKQQSDAQTPAITASSDRAQSNSGGRAPRQAQRRRMTTALQIERYKVVNDKKLKEQELRLQELQFNASQRGLAQIFTPAGAAVLAGLVGLLGTYLNGVANTQLEDKKQQGILILEAIKTAGSDKEKEQKTAANLVFLARAGLIIIPNDNLKILKEKAGDHLPDLPSSSISPLTISLPPSFTVNTTLMDLANYLSSNYNTTSKRALIVVVRAISRATGNSLPQDQAIAKSIKNVVQSGVDASQTDISIAGALTIRDFLGGNSSQFESLKPMLWRDIQLNIQ